MERAHLNQKSWYRGLKVLFVIAFLLAQGFGFIITYALVSGTIPYVYCDNGKGFKDDSLHNDGIYSYYFYQCDPTAYYFNGSGTKGTLTSEQYNQLNKLVLQMQAQGTLLESDFQSAVDNFKTKYVSPAPTNLAGNPFRDLIPGYSFYKPEPVVQNQGFRPFFKGKDSNNWTADFSIGNMNVYSFARKSEFYLLSFVIVSIIFWLISRIFFYVFTGERFLKIRTR